MSSHMPECTSKCRSLQHALDVISVVTRGSEGQIKAFLSSYCYNAATIKDAFGRNVIHLASSCGKKGVLDWLAETKGVDLLAKDKESGWTALHRSIFYGYIDCVLSLLKHGVSLYVQDKEGLSALDLVMKDRPIHVVFKKTDPTEVYTWGNNINFTLGHGGQQGKHHPELVDLFPRNGVYIKQVVLCKFHSVFLSHKGQVYTCGHGQGGRLGHGDEQTCLVPRLVEGLAGHQCSQIAAAKDHTVILTEDGYVYTFGLNTFHQLGILPPPSNCSVPRQVQAKNLKGRMVIGVAAGRFHTVLWTKEAVYTMGLNGGQLGYLLDPNGEKCVTAPRQVSALHHKDISVSLVSASDGATVCVTERGDIYLLADYQCKKIASKQLNLKKVLVSGGYLEYKVDTQHLKENGGQKICILALDEAGRVFCWKSSNNSMKQCRWVYGRQVFMSDVALNGNEIMFVTQDGEAFTGKWLEEGKKISEKKAELVSSLQNSSYDVSCEHDANSVYERIRLQKLTFVHRAVSIATDPSGCNFAVLQSDPKTSLYEIPSVSLSSFGMDFGKLLDETDEMDSIHDVTFQIGTRTYPVHKYILAVRSDFFRKLFVSSDNQLDTPDIYRKDEDAVGCDLYVVEKVHPDLFAYLLQFIYTDTCDLLTHGYKPKIPCKEKSEEYQNTLISNLSKMSFDENVNGKSAFEIYRNNQVQVMNEKQKSKSKKGKAGEEANLIKMLQSAAKKFGLSNLSGRLDGVRLENGKIIVVNKKNGNKPKLNQKKCSYLCDVTLKSLDGKEFPCHKCVLCARLDYFHSMLSSSWIEATCCSALEMPIHSDILQIIVDYLYTDEALAIKDSQNVEFMCNVLVVADQLLISRLKEICEVAIAEKLTLKNAAELLEFSAMYNAEQLKLSCLQFIGLNMAALLEARTLDVLSDDVVKDLSVYYRKMIPAMVRRVITPYPDGPDISSFEPEDGENCVFLREEMNTEQNSQEALFKRAKNKAKKKPRKRSDSSGGYNLSDIIQSPASTGSVKLDKTNSVESLPELLTSDSEGSYAGVGSPRDLQSPDFTKGFHPERTEMKDKACAQGMKASQANKEMKSYKGASALKQSVPQSIPSARHNSASSPNWVATTFSPASPPAMDLRTIMEIEESMQKCGTMPKANSGRMVSHGTKLSQKQRKMIALAAKDNGSISSSMEPTAIVTTPPPPTKVAKLGNAWSSSLHSALPKSFRDLVMEEEKSMSVNSSSGTAIRRCGYKGSEDSLVQNTLRCTSSSPGLEDHVVDSPQLENHNPWSAASPASSPVMAPVMFSAIVEEELQQEAALIRSREKPLALIQIEECAIQDLLIHYEAFDNPDEFVTVERASQGPIAAPMWNKH
ncbi:inhibitor of Bruton tyrosine kinase isoform X1 [Manacus vitellinus]|uniref:inhibitor of Bruton tyrosine kinase isoform X1 n=1 Tax=Manacus vitellinus TaxID=328815 RepID=UPI00115CA8BD|nr:inhibitor of Bruton tyrosine kinase isoform X1 [Manacus vitellinus]XP_029818568.1 inhibitor of Bruton tyrosine kinase isoform X1 [Manacus vitellinus]